LLVSSFWLIVLSLKLLNKLIITESKLSFF
jgi:hypothetical protein